MSKDFGNRPSFVADTLLNLHMVHENGDGTFVVTNHSNYRILKTPYGLNYVTSGEERRQLMERVIACVNFCREFGTEFLETHRLHAIRDQNDWVPDSCDGYVPVLPVVKENTRG